MSEICLKEKTNLSILRKQRRREKSRDAARCRRHKESDIFEEICNELPIPYDVISHLDKTAIIRLLISYTKLRQVLHTNSDALTCKVRTETECDLIPTDQDHVTALNSFVFVLSSDFDVLFVTDNVKKHLGLSQFDLIGQNIMMYAHEGDYDDLKSSFDNDNGYSSFFVRFKTTLTADGKNTKLNSAYKVLHCTGTVCTGPNDTSYLIAHAKPIPHPSNIEHLLDSSTFLSQHTPDMKFTYCDEKLLSLLKYDEADVEDVSLYQFCHAADVKALGMSFQKLYRMNQIETDEYRILAKTGGYCSVITQATVITNQKTRKPQYIVCVHSVVSNLVHENLPLSIQQLEHGCQIPANPSLPSSSHELANKDEVVVDNDKAEVDEELELALNTDFDDFDCFDDDDCYVAPMNFTALDDADELQAKGLCFNAPSIGDPWSFCDDNKVQTDNLDDLFPDVDNQKYQSFSAISSSDNDVTTKNSYQEINRHQFQQYRVNTSSFDSSSDCASLSPNRSAFTGSPEYVIDHDFVCVDPNTMVEDLKKPIDPSYSASYSPPLVSYLTVQVPRDDFVRHSSNLKRGYVEDKFDKDGVYLKPNRKKFKGNMKKKRLDQTPPILTKTPNVEKGFPEVSTSSNLETSYLPQPELQIMKDDGTDRLNEFSSLNLLLQPGQGYGCCNSPDLTSTTDKFASFLLQPGLKVDESTGRRVLAHKSNGFLPELSLLDCEVNAPLEENQDPLPFATDCIRLLNCVN